MKITPDQNIMPRWVSKKANYICMRPPPPTRPHCAPENLKKMPWLYLKFKKPAMALLDFSPQDSLQSLPKVLGSSRIGSRVVELDGLDARQSRVVKLPPEQRDPVRNRGQVPAKPGGPVRGLQVPPNVA
jgi:hypothetical protein